MFPQWGPSLDAEIAYRREDLLRSTGRRVSRRRQAPRTPPVPAGTPAGRREAVARAA